MEPDAIFSNMELCCRSGPTLEANKPKSAMLHSPVDSTVQPFAACDLL